MSATSPVHQVKQGKSTPSWYLLKYLLKDQTAVFSVVETQARLSLHAGHFQATLAPGVTYLNINIPLNSPSNAAPPY